MSVLSFVGENIIKCAKIIERLRIFVPNNVPDLPEDFLKVHSAYTFQ